MVICCNILNIIYNIQNINNVRTSVSLQIEVHLGKLNRVELKNKNNSGDDDCPFSVQDNCECVGYICDLRSN
jgi:hypothetical protein